MPSGSPDVQFGAYRLPDGGLVLDLQPDVLSHLSTRLVAPLVPEAGTRPVTILEPVLEVQGARLVLLTSEMMTIRAKLLRELPVARLVDADYTIRKALDMMFSGF
jgi:toxin CcdB